MYIMASSPFAAEGGIKIIKEWRKPFFSTNRPVRAPLLFSYSGTSFLLRQEKAFDKKGQDGLPFGRFHGAAARIWLILRED
ncbi:MAG TPA: hypothetical protein H9926_12950 [Candidatus Eisenbergiella intestinigallinarum]|uniref:Uncharacterized protein n=1 Tax=Candidatus Eisenbergiella intestinigallinarum TaxID=2838549 RepID=A0A9D2QM33_9FIRM|nr:hypothetical protein [Candidatus Eisenbergiella intestinigallinarum]